MRPRVKWSPTGAVAERARNHECLLGHPLTPESHLSCPQGELRGHTKGTVSLHPYPCQICTRQMLGVAGIPSNLGGRMLARTEDEALLSPPPGSEAVWERGWAPRWPPSLPAHFPNEIWNVAISATADKHRHLSLPPSRVTGCSAGTAMNHPRPAAPAPPGPAVAARPPTPAPRPGAGHRSPSGKERRRGCTAFGFCWEKWNKMPGTAKEKRGELAGSQTLLCLGSLCRRGKRSRGTPFGWMLCPSLCRITAHRTLQDHFSYGKKPNKLWIPQSQQLHFSSTWHNQPSSQPSCPHRVTFLVFLQASSSSLSKI